MKGFTGLGSCLEFQGRRVYSGLSPQTRPTLGLCSICLAFFEGEGEREGGKGGV